MPASGATCLQGVRSQPLPLFRRYESRWWKCFVICDIIEGLWSRALGQRTQSRSACSVRTAPKRKWPLLQAPTRTYWKSVTMLIHVDKNEKRKEKKKPRTPTLSQMSITCVYEETPTIYVKGSLWMTQTVRCRKKILLLGQSVRMPLQCLFSWNFP